MLSQVLLSADSSDPGSRTADELLNLDREEFDGLAALAQANHVIVRGLAVVHNIYVEAGDTVRAEWTAAALAAERKRIATAVEFLGTICAAIEQKGLDVTVIKSLDHWPDMGSDIDLYTSSPAKAVSDVMRREFGAQIAARSWGDRLACKWNFNLPGLAEPVEVHIGRLGQTGEQVVLASRLPGRSRRAIIAGRAFHVAAVSDRLMISTLQRMYRHFYFCLCDIVDSAALALSGAIDYEELRFSAQEAGIWEGVATYLTIVSDYVQAYRGADLELPRLVRQDARFGGELVYFSRDYLRVPILPQSAGLYRRQLTGLLRRREVHSSARLGLLPWLATAAAVGHKLTGSDKGIW